MKKIFKILTFIFIVTLCVTNGAAKASAEEICGTGLICDQASVTASQLGATPNSTVTLQAQWSKVIAVYGSFFEYNTNAQKPTFLAMIDGDNASAANLSSAESLVNWTICPASNPSCSNTTQTNAGIYTLNVSTKNANNAVLLMPVTSGSDSGGTGNAGTSSSGYKFTIIPFDISKTSGGNPVTTVTITPGTYNGGSQIPNVVVKTTIGGNTITLQRDTVGDGSTGDYRIDNISGDFTSPGNHTFKIVGINNYQGTIDNLTYVINGKSISGLTVSAIADQYYTGSAITPAVVVKDGTKTLTKDVDYTISYSNNTAVGNATATITGKGSYSATKTVNFKIIPNVFDVIEVNGSAVYNGNPQDGGAIVKVTNSNATGASIKYGTSSGSYTSTSVPKFTDAGTHKVYYEVTKTGFTTKTGTLNIVITKSSNAVTLDKTVYKTVFPNPVVATVTSAYSGSITVTKPSGSIANYSVSGNKITITPTKEGTEDFVVSVLGGANYDTVTITATLVVDKGSMSVTTTPTSTITYDGNTHSIAFTPPAGSSTTFTWDENGVAKNSTSAPSFKDAGTHVVSYTTTKTGYTPVYGTSILKIEPKAIASSWITLSGSEFNFTGNAIKPTVTVKDPVLGNLVEGTDYVVTYSNNVLPGSATVKISGVGNYKGTPSVNFTIKSLSLDYTVINGHAVYTGYSTSGTDPKAEVIVSKPSSYTVSYSTVLPGCDGGGYACAPEAKNYTSPSMPRFKDVGVHTVWYRITAPGYQTIEGTLTITIDKRIIDLPNPYPTEGLLYTGQSQSPSWTGFNSKYMNISGEISGTNPGTYNAVFKITEPENVEWYDHSTGDKTVPWTITKISIQDHETITELGIDYDEWKQITVNDGRIKYDRPGYDQIGWVSDCNDFNNLTLDLMDRSCNYNNIFEVGSSVFGGYVAEQVGYNEDVPYDLYAVWSTITYRITYDLCDPKGCGEFDGAITAIAAYDVPFAVTDPIRPGYIFKGWEITEMDETPHTIAYDTTSQTTYTTSEDWVGETLYFKNLTSKQDWTVKFKALWEPISFKLRFDSNIDSYKDDNGVQTTATMSGNTIEMVMTYDVPKNLSVNGYEMTGYHFNGWSQFPDWKNPGYTYGDQEFVVNLEFIDWKKMAREHWSAQEIENYLSDTRLYSRWLRNSDTEFTVTFWKQRVGAGLEPNNVNYEMVGKETYRGETDRNMILTPYFYKGTYGSSSADYQVNTSIDTGSSAHLKLVSQSWSDYSPNKTTDPAVNFKATSSTSINDDYFRGFTDYRAYVDSGNKRVDNATSSYPVTLQQSYAPMAGSMTILPDGSRNIDVYYVRNTYTITYYLNGGANDPGNPGTRQYQVTVTFKDPNSNASLLNGSGDFEGTNQTKDAEFEGWYSNSNVTVKILGIDGEVVTDENVWARWMQYRYSGAGKVENQWTPWGKINE